MDSLILAFFNQHSKHSYVRTSTRILIVTSHPSDCCSLQILSKKVCKHSGGGTKGYFDPFLPRSVLKKYLTLSRIVLLPLDNFPCLVNNIVLAMCCYIDHLELKGNL